MDMSIELSKDAAKWIWDWKITHHSVNGLLIKALTGLLPKTWYPPQTPSNKSFGRATALAVMMFQPQQKYRKEMQEIDRYTLDVFNSFFSYKRFLWVHMVKNWNRNTPSSLTWNTPIRTARGHGNNPVLCLGTSNQSHETWSSYIKQHKIAAIEVTSSSISSLQIGRGFKKEK